MVVSFSFPAYSQEASSPYQFTWDPNHPSENVVYYRLRFGPGEDDYDPDYDWPRIDGGSTSSFSFTLPDPKSVILPDNFYPLENVDTVYFALTAVDEDGYESGLSENQPSVSISLSDPSNGANNGNGNENGEQDGDGGGGSGGCLIEIVISK